jgi:hypothetical protein
MKKKSRHPIFEPQYVSADCSQLKIEGILAERSLRAFIEENGDIGLKELVRRSLDKSAEESDTADGPMNIES